MVTIVWPEPGVDTSLNVTTGAKSTLSVAVALPRADTLVSAGASSVTLGGSDSTGSSVSTTVTI